MLAADSERTLQRAACVVCALHCCAQMLRPAPQLGDCIYLWLCIGVCRAVASLGVCVGSLPASCTILAPDNAEENVSHARAAACCRPDPTLSMRCESVAPSSLQRCCSSGTTRSTAGNDTGSAALHAPQRWPAMLKIPLRASLTPSERCVAQLTLSRDASDP